MTKKKPETNEDERPSVRVIKDGRYWDRSDLERFHIQEYLAAQESIGKKSIIQFVLRNGKAVSGRFVELGTYAYAIDAKVGEQVRRIVVPKHAIDYVILGEDTKGGE